MRTAIRRVAVTALALLVVLGFGVAARAQEGAEQAEEPEGVEAELAGSAQFRNVLVVAPVNASGLKVEARIYNARATVFSAGVAWTASLGEWGTLYPGVSLLLGDLSRTAPAFTARYEVERGRFVGALGLVQALSETNAGEDEEGEGQVSGRYDNISDGNHVSYRLTDVLTLGYTWEHVQYRRESEWKSGIRGAYRFRPGAEVTTLLLWPDGPEVRVGLKLKGL